MEFESSLSCSQQPTTGFYDKSAESSSHPHTQFLWDPLHPIYTQVSQIISSLQVSRLIYIYIYSHLPMCAKAHLYYYPLFHHPNNTWIAGVAQSVQRLATGWTIEVRRFDSQWWLGIFPFFTASRPALGPTQPPIKSVQGTFSSGEKRQGREADHFLPSSAEVKNAWLYTSTPQYVFMA
jgi:hypothetical protein